MTKLLSVLQPFLPPLRAQPEIIFPPNTALQSDLCSCGVLVIVDALFLAAGLDPPSTINVPLWRCLLLAMATEQPLISSLPPHLTAIDLAEHIDALTHEADAEALSDPAPTTPLVLAEATHIRATTMTTR